MEFIQPSRIQGSVSHGATFCHASVLLPFILSCPGNKCVHSSLSLDFLSFLYSFFIQKFFTLWPHRGLWWQIGRCRCIIVKTRANWIRPYTGQCETPWGACYSNLRVRLLCGMILGSTLYTFCVTNNKYLRIYLIFVEI